MNISLSFSCEVFVLVVFVLTLDEVCLSKVVGLGFGRVYLF